MQHHTSARRAAAEAMHTVGPQLGVTSLLPLWTRCFPKGKAFRQRLEMKGPPCCEPRTSGPSQGGEGSGNSQPAGAGSYTGGRSWSQVMLEKQAMMGRSDLTPSL